MSVICKQIQASDTKGLKKAFDVRKRVFVEEQNVDHEIEYDGKDDESIHYILSVDDLMIGTARWRETDRGIKLERFAVLPEYRNNGFGSVMLRKVMEDVKSLNKEIYLHAQLKAVPYYERQGFTKRGDVFVEANIEHYEMVFVF